MHYEYFLCVHVFTAADKFTSCFRCVFVYAPLINLAYILCVASLYLCVCVCVCLLLLLFVVALEMLLYRVYVSVYLPNCVFPWTAVEPAMSYALWLQVVRVDDNCRSQRRLQISQRHSFRSSNLLLSAPYQLHEILCKNKVTHHSHKLRNWQQRIT